MSSGLDINNVPFILLTDGKVVYVDSLNKGGKMPILSANSPISLITHSITFRDNGQLAIKQKKTLPKAMKDIAGIPSSDYFLHFSYIPIPSRQGVILKDRDDMYYYYSLSNPTLIYGLYNIDEVLAQEQGIIKTPLIGNLNKYDYLKEHWNDYSLGDIFQEYDHLFFVMTSFDNQMSLISFAKDLNYHNNYYPITELRILNGSLVENIRADLLAIKMQRQRPPIEIPEYTEQRNNTIARKASPNEFEEVLTVLNTLGEFGLFTEEINEINTVLRIIDLFL